MSIPASEDASAYEGAMKKRERSFQKSSGSNHSLDDTTSKVKLKSINFDRIKAGYYEIRMG